MSDFVVTHRSRAGLEVRAGERGRTGRVFVYHAASPDVGIGFPPREFSLFFEPIPKPQTVTISKATADACWDMLTPRRKNPFVIALGNAIAEAKREEAKDGV